jgi:hypothetical protein
VILDRVHARNEILVVRRLVRNNPARSGFRRRREIRKIEVPEPLPDISDRLVEINLVLVVVEPENMNGVGKMIEHEIHVPDDELGFRNADRILLLREMDRVAALAELVAEVADARAGKRNAVRRQHILRGDLELRV